MKRIIKAGFMMLLGAAIWTNGGDVKEANAQICGDGGQYTVDNTNGPICVGGTSGNRGYGTHPDDGRGPQPQRPTNTRPVPPKPSSYGAVAWSDSAIGTSSNKSTRQDAVNVALQNCGKTNCEIVTEYWNQCVGVSYGVQANSKYLWKTGFGSSAKVAEKNALLNCKKDGAKNCKVHFSDCSLP